ncbi:hypothetical protein ACN47A_32585 [Myxococcus fulvus]|uniref:hypothetical protein n=1 Tax=Myxococcus fulvus TaxID=33 RepID=UPI003B9D87D9
MTARARWIAFLGIVISLGLAALLRHGLVSRREMAPTTAHLPASKSERPFLFGHPLMGWEGGRRGWGAAPPRLTMRPRPSLKGTGRVVVKVVSALTGEGLEGASVLMSRELEPDGSRLLEPETLASAVTDAAGHVGFDTVRAGILNVCARGTSWRERCERNVGVVAGGVLEVRLRLVEGATLRGQLLTSEGSPVPDAELVSWSRDEWMGPRKVRADAQGRFEFRGIPPGFGWVMPRMTEGKTDERWFRFSPHERSQEYDIRLQQFVPLTLIPVHQGGRGRITSVTLESTPLARHQDGSWRGRVEAGSRFVELMAGCRTLASDFVHPAAGAANVFRIPYVAAPAYTGAECLADPMMPGPFELAGHVLREDGAPVERFHLAVEVRGDNRYAHYQEPFASFDRYRFSGSSFVVHPQHKGRPQRVFAWTDDGRAGEAVVDSERDEGPVSVDIVLKETGGVSGRLLGLYMEEWERYRLNPLSHAERVRVDMLPLGPTMSIDDDGTFFLAGLSPGVHELGGKLLEPYASFGTAPRVLTLPGVVTELGDLSRGLSGPVPSEEDVAASR